MARTPAGEQLTSQHRQRQLQLRAAVLQDFLAVWPLWRSDRESFDRLVQVTVPLIAVRRRVSAGLASDYYRAFRLAEDAPGAAAPRVTGNVPRDKIITSLYVTGLRQFSRSVTAGFSPQAARQNTLTTMSGSVARHVLDGGRETIIQSVASDPATVGWQRVTDGAPCSFCALLAARGAVYSEGPSGFRAHDHCGCSAEPRYEGSQMRPEAQRWAEMYRQAQREGGSSGTSNDQLNNFRRFYEAQTSAA